MKTHPRKSLLPALISLLSALIFTPLLANAAQVSLTTSDQGGKSSLFGPAGVLVTNWNNLQPPSAANDYFTATFFARTPADGNSYTFAGNSLTLQVPSGQGSPMRSIIFKGSGNNVYTINNLTNAGGIINSGAGNVGAPTFTGNLMTVISNSTIMPDQGSFIIGYPITGAAGVILTNTSGQARTVTYTGNLSAFQGKFYINSSITVAFGAGSTILGNPPTPEPDQILIGAGCTLADNVGLNFNNANGGFTLAGSASISAGGTTTISEPITDNGGGFSLTSSGAGTLVLSGANNYSGGTVVSAGTVKLGAANAVPAGNVNLTGELDLNTFNDTIDGLTGAGTIDTTTGGGPVLTIGINGGGGTFTGTIQNSSGTLNLTKVGAGTETLANGYTYSGTTTVSGGTLNLLTSVSVPVSAGDLVVNNSAALSVDASSGTQLPANNLTIGPAGTLNLNLVGTATGINPRGTITFQNNSTNNFTYGTVSANPTFPAINAAGGISAPGATVVINISAVGLQPGTFTLIKYSGTPLASISNFILNPPPGLQATLVNNMVNDSIDIEITSAPRNLVWNGGNGTAWDFTTANWTAGGSPAEFQGYTNGTVIAGDGVLFDDTLANPPDSTNVNLTALFYPFPIIVNSTQPYSFSGVGGLAGPSSLVKSNTGSLTITTSNSYTGGTFIYGGNIVLTSDSALGAPSGGLTLAGGGLQVNGSITNSRAVAIPSDSTIDVASGANAQLGGRISGAGALTKTDSGTITFTGTNTIAGALTISQGTFTSSGSNSLPAVATVGDTGSENATLNLTGGTFNAGNNGGQFTSSLVVGSVAAAAGDIRLNSGNLDVDQQFGLGAGLGGYAGFTMTGGVLGSGSYIVVGFATDDAVYNQSGGSTIVSNNLMTIAAGGASSVGVANISGGSYIATNSTSGNNTTEGGIFVGEVGNGTLNVSGAATITAIGQANFTIGRDAGSSGTANLDGGTVVTGQALKGAGAALLNFNGGTLKASGGSATFISGLPATVYNNGAVIDDGGFAITVPVALQAPTGYGVNTIAVANGGSGYIDSPIVTISGGAGSNATATATVAGGAVTAITVTCPGTGYNNGDTLSVSFTGGGASPVSATAGAVSFVQNGTGGLTKKGAGTLTLSGSNTLGGPITVSAGTLSLNSASTYPGAVNVNAGTLALTTASKLNGSTTISNAATLSLTQVGNATATLGNVTFDGAVALPGATLGLGLTASNNPAVPFVTCGTLTINGTNSISVAGAVNIGTTALVKYSGALAGSGTLTNALLPQGATGSISNDVADSILYLVVTSTGPGLVWTGTNSSPSLTNLWDINSTKNWLIGSTATTYHQTIIPGDAVTFNDVGSGTVILNTTVGPASLVISNNSTPYTFRGTGAVTGPTGLEKDGTGTAQFNITNSSYAGTTLINGGTLQVGNTGVGNSLSPNASLAIGANGTLGLSAQLANVVTTVGDFSGAGLINYSGGNNSILQFGAANGGTWSGTIQDAGGGGLSLTKVGSGTWTVTGTNHLDNGDFFNAVSQVQFNNGTTIVTNGGSIIDPFIEFWIAEGAGSTSTVVVANGGSISVGNDWLVVGRNDPTANGTLIVNGGTVSRAGANDIIVGSLGATGNLIVNSGQVLNTSSLLLGENGGSGTLHLNGGLIQADLVRPNGTTPATSLIDFNGGTLQATASTNDFIQTGTTAQVQSGGAVIDDGGNAISLTSTALSEDPSSTGGGLTKIGAGTLYLDLAQTYTGPTFVNAGTLAGVGSIAGPVTINPGGNLGIGDAGSAAGVFGINNSVTFHGQATFRIDKTGGNRTSDQLNSVTTANYGGTLVITNVTTDGTPLALGDTFNLVSATTHNGTFNTIVGSAGPGLGFSFANGVLTVVNGVASNPTNLTFSVSGGTLTLSWPADHLGWILQSQTNSLSTGITTHWFDIGGSSSVTSVNYGLGSTNPTVFYRLRHP